MFIVMCQVYNDMLKSCFIMTLYAFARRFVTHDFGKNNFGEKVNVTFF